MDYFGITALKILVLLNPFAVLTTFLALTSRYDRRERTRVVYCCSAAVLLAGGILFFSGNLLFAALDINVDLFKAGGGVILMICAVSLVWGKDENKVSSECRGTGIAVVPLAIPMAVGPGTSAGIIVIGLEKSSWHQTVAALAALVLATLLLAMLLLAGAHLERWVHKSGISVITRLTGLFLSAIAAKMILEGVKNTFAA